MRIINLCLSLWILLYSLNAFAQQDFISSDEQEDIIEESSLSFIPLETINLLEEEREDTRLWHHSNPALLQDLLMALPIEPKQFGSLKSFVLKSPIFLERSTPAYSTILMNIRLYHLALSGDTDTLFRYVNNIPKHRVTENVNRYTLLGLFVAKQAEQACRDFPKSLAEYSNNFWQQVLIYCQAYNQQSAQLDLSLKLVKEDKTILDSQLMDLITLMQKKKRDEKKIHQEWIAFLQDQLTPHHPYIKIFPTPPVLYSAIMSQTELEEKWPKETDKNTAESIKQMASLYNLLFSNNVSISFRRWNRLWLYALSQNIQPPEILTHHYLLSALKENRLGTALISVTHILTAYPLDSFSDYLVSDILYVLHFLGLHNEAEALSRELLTHNSL